MPKYRVRLLSYIKVWEEGYLEIEADSEDDARDLADDMLTEGVADFEEYERDVQDSYVDDIEELEDSSDSSEGTLQ